MKQLLIIITLLFSAVSCKNETSKQPHANVTSDFDPSVLNSEMAPVKQVYGQLLYLPVYSNVPYHIDTIKFDMSAFIAIHNTDFTTPIVLSKVLYFDQEGKLVGDYLTSGNITIEPLATRDFYVPYEDQSGTGANFLVEWTADTLVNEPLIESITTSLKPNNTVAILSPGKVIRERK